MKKNEIALLVLVVGICLICGYWAGQSVLGNPVSKAVQIEDIEVISSDVATPDSRIFNDSSINPTVPVNVNIDDKNSQQPF
jgi:hypothetical protein